MSDVEHHLAEANFQPHRHTGGAAVVDDGPGFDLLQRPMNGVGLISMRERARQVGGSVTVTSKPGLGTHVHVRVPTGGSATCAAAVPPT